MFKRRRLGALGLLAGTTLLMVGALASPATAEVIQGPCTGSATFSNGVAVTESTPLSQVVEVPSKDIVQWNGDTHLSEPAEEEPFSGYVAVRLPLGGEWVVADWPDPPGETKQTSDSGSYGYEVPSYVPQGTGGLEVTAYHTQRGQVCQVALTMTVSGSPGPAAIAAAVITALAGGGVIGAGFSKGKLRI